MSQSVYDDIMWTEKLMRGDRMEMTVVIYETSDTVRLHDPNTEMEDLNTKRNLQIQHPERKTAGVRCYRLAAVCLGLLCVLLLSAITVLWIKFNNLNTERNQLHTSYTKLTEDMDKLFLELGWRYYGSSLYFISTEKKSWEESRKFCTDRQADLVIIDRKEEQEFINKTFGSTEAWIGLTDSVTEGVWKWVDNKTLTTGFWWRGEPNNYQNYEDCALTGYKHAAPSNGSTWGDYPCSFPLAGICEKLIY